PEETELKDIRKIKVNDKNKVKLIMCEVVLDEIKDKFPPGWEIIEFEKKLHEHSDKLRDKLQKEIDRSVDFDIIFLGYGLCGKSTEGLSSTESILVIPRCDDCISMFLGSVQEYKKQFKKEPGSYYLTRGYIGEKDDAGILGFSEIRDKYDEETWKWVIKEMLKNYKRLVYVNTGNYDPEQWRNFAKKEAEKLDLRFEEVKGSGDFFKKMIEGKWDDDFVVVKPGEIITAGMFER
ncbi:MAG: DUF1638 domain-containing protein, partial [Candidatus Humimicrobiaceae bacterium]